MNIVFHIVTAIGTVAAITPVDEIETKKSSIIVSFGAFIAGIIIHGALDYIPHNYPLSGTLDIVVGFSFIILLTFLSKPHFRIIVVCTLLGSIFPDLVDLLPSILNKYLGLDFPIGDKLFPWHYPEYSGSIFSKDVNIVSNINHFMVIFLTFIICFMRKKELKRIFL